MDSGTPPSSPEEKHGECLERVLNLPEPLPMEIEEVDKEMDPNKLGVAAGRSSRLGMIGGFCGAKANLKGTVVPSREGEASL